MNKPEITPPSHSNHFRDSTACYVIVGLSDPNSAPYELGMISMLGLKTALVDSDAKRNVVVEGDFGIEAEKCQEGLSGSFEAEALSGREIVHQHDILEVGLVEPVDVQLSG